MSNSDLPKSHTGLFTVLFTGLALSLVGNLYLIAHSARTDRKLAEVQDGTQSQISQLSNATTTLLEQRLQQLKGEVRDAQENSTTALQKARAEAHAQGTTLRKNLQDQQRQVAAEITRVKEGADSRITEVSSDVNNVKTDVTGVKEDVTGVKANVATTQSDLEKTSTDLKRVKGDMGVMSGLIATNSKDLDVLRQLGERNYIEFDISKKQQQIKVGNLTLALRQADPKKNRYTIQILADDKQVEKKDRTVNEPVQFYIGGSHQPYEIVVNQVKKDEVVGYLATPKVTTASR